MARRTYKRDKIGRFASTGGSSRKSKSKKPRKSDVAFQKSGKGGGTSVKAGRAAKAAYKKKEGARRKSATARKGGSFTKTSTFKGSQRKKQAAAKRTGYSKGAFESATRKSTTRGVTKPRRRSTNQGVRGESQATKRDRAVRISERRVRSSFGTKDFDKNMRRYSRAMEAQTRRMGARLPGF